MPQRFLRPGLTTSQRYNACSWEAQNLFTRLLTLVDDFGRYDAEPRLLRSHAFPFGDPSGREIKLPAIEMMCENLSLAGLAVFYKAADGKKYLQVTRWQERARAEKSKFPDFDNTCEQMFSSDNKCSPPSSSSSPSSSPLHHRQSTHGSKEPDVQSDTEWLNELTQSEAYRGINVRREYAKMLEWAKLPRNRKKKPTRRRFINWLNNCEPSIHHDAGPKPLDPAKIELPTAFREWAKGKYPTKEGETAGYKTWADVPDWMRAEWRREKVDPITRSIAA